MGHVQVVYHRADFDGLFSGAVCLHWLKKQGHKVTLSGWDFGDPQIAAVNGVDLVFVVDLPPDALAEWESWKDTCKLIWIDHHKSSIEKFGNLAGYQIDGVAACRLCWNWFTCEEQNPVTGSLATKGEYVNRQVKEPRAVTLAGEYDVWDKRDPEAEKFQFGLTANGFNSPEMVASVFFDQGIEMRFTIDDICQQGEPAMAWQQAYAADVCKSRGYRVFSDGLWFWCLASVHARNSMWFPEGSVPDDCDALMCYRIEGDGYVKFSLYHKPGQEELDLSEIAVKWGGGGHKGACGFQITMGKAICAGYILESPEPSPSPLPQEGH